MEHFIQMVILSRPLQGLKVCGHSFRGFSEQFIDVVNESHVYDFGEMIVVDVGDQAGRVPRLDHVSVGVGRPQVINSLKGDTHFQDILNRLSNLVKVFLAFWGTDVGQRAFQISDILFQNHGLHLLPQLLQFTGHHPFLKLVNNFIMSRPSFGELMMETARLWSQRSTCRRLKVGAVISHGSRIVSIGYNGAARGMPHCTEVFSNCPEDEFKRDHHEWSVHNESHAEENAINSAALNGVTTRGATMFTLYFPCIRCANCIINAGIKEVMFESHYYQDEEQIRHVQTMFETNHVEIIQASVKTTAPVCQ